MKLIEKPSSNIRAVKEALQRVEDTLDTGFELKHRKAVLDFEAEIRILLGKLKADFHDAIKPITEEDIDERIEEIKASF